MSHRLHKGVAAAAMAFGLLASGAANAQELPSASPLQPPPADSVLTGVTISVPKVVDKTRYGVVSSEVQLSVRVPYSDLDMKTPAGVAELNRRVKEGADYVCRQLVNMYPVGTPDTVGCVREALGGAQPQITRASAPG